MRGVLGLIDPASTAREAPPEPLPVDDPKVRQPDITKARKYLSWEPEVDLDDGLKRTIEYFKQALRVK